jgi:hypothetical protein
MLNAIWADHDGRAVLGVNCLRTLGSWVRIPLKVWMSVYTFILCLCCRVCRYRPCDGLITRPRSPTVCENDCGTEEEARARRGL